MVQYEANAFRNFGGLRLGEIAEQIEVGTKVLQNLKLVVPEYNKTSHKWYYSTRKPHISGARVREN